MMQLSGPKYSCEQALDACISGITGNQVLFEKLSTGKAQLITAEAQYKDLGTTGELYTIAPVDDHDHDADPVVLDSLTKNELIKIYDQYFVPEKKPARKIYEALLNAAKERCPFCGGIGTPSNLDHYLPKIAFPQFSVLPFNLVPACRDCNMGLKSRSFASDAAAQIIQPYLDSNVFYLEQWISATFRAGAASRPGKVEYSVSPPEAWNELDKQRVKKHFECFDIAKRYSIKAAEQLGTVLSQIRSMRKERISNTLVISCILQPGIDASPFVNHWQRGMYQALSQAVVDDVALE